MKIRRFCNLVALACALCTPVVTGTPAGDVAVPPGCEPFVHQQLWHYGQEVVLPEQPYDPASATIKIPAEATRQRGGFGLLFQARYDSPKPGGLATVLEIKVNGSPLEPDKAPLLNRKLSANTFPAFQGYAIRWWIPKDESARLVVQAVPDFASWNEEITEGSEEGHWYLLEVTEFIHPGDENVIEFTNHPPERSGSYPHLGLVLENIVLVSL